MGCSAHVIPTQRQTSVAPDPADGPLTTLPEGTVVLALADGPPPGAFAKKRRSRWAYAAQDAGSEHRHPDHRKRTHPAGYGRLKAWWGLLVLVIRIVW